MKSVSRRGTLTEFLALTSRLSIDRTAEILRCCTCAIRNYVAGRSPIPWHRVQVLRLHALESGQCTTHARGAAPEPHQASAIEANIPSDPSAPDVPPDEMLAWVGVHAPHYLSSQRSFAHYVRGRSVVDKIRRAKQEGTFVAVLARWRVLVVELPRMWRSGPLWAGIGPPAYRSREPDSQYNWTQNRHYKQEVGRRIAFVILRRDDPLLGPAGRAEPRDNRLYFAHSQSPYASPLRAGHS